MLCVCVCVLTDDVISLPVLEMAVESRSPGDRAASTPPPLHLSVSISSLSSSLPSLSLPLCLPPLGDDIGE